MEERREEERRKRKIDGACVDKRGSPDWRPHAANRAPPLQHPLFFFFFSSPLLFSWTHLSSFLLSIHLQLQRHLHLLPSHSLLSSDCHDPWFGSPLTSSAPDSPPPPPPALIGSRPASTTSTTVIPNSPRPPLFSIRGLVELLYFLLRSQQFRHRLRQSPKCRPAVPSHLFASPSVTARNWTPMKPSEPSAIT